MDQGRDPQQPFSGLIVIGTVNIIGVLSDPVSIYTVVQHWRLATDCDRIAVGLPLVSIHAYKVHINMYSSQYTSCLTKWLFPLTNFPFRFRSVAFALN